MYNKECTRLDTFAAEGRDGNGEVVAIDEADVIEVLVVAEGNLGKRGGRGSTEAVAEKVSAAVSGGAAAAAGGVEGAAVAAPHAARPAGGKLEGVGLVRQQLESALGQNRFPTARLDSRPDRVGALVVHRHCCT